MAPQAAFYAMPQVTLPAGSTDEDFVLGLLRAKGILCVHGSGFGLPAEGGYFRVVFLALAGRAERHLRRRRRLRARVPVGLMTRPRAGQRQGACPP